MCVVAVSAGCHPRAATTTMPDLAVAESSDLGTGDVGDLASSADAGPTIGGVDWSRQVIYLAIVDRFANGSTANDTLGLPNCFDPSDAQKWHGGDFAGMQQKLGYLTELGVGALWITPAAEQAAGPT